MSAGYTRASDGGSKPPPFLELQQARARLGEMKFRADLSAEDQDTALGQLFIHHPNITGQQLDQPMRAFIPAECMSRRW